MSPTPGMFASLLAHWEDLTPGRRERIIILAGLGLITAGVSAWSLFFRRSRRRRHRHHQRHAASSAPAQPQAAAVEDSESSHSRRKWRRQHRDHRPRNPTLAETGGLPPVRSGDPPEILP